MYALGIDIGTTNLNLSLVDLETGGIIERRSTANRRIPSGDEYAYQQDPAGIAESVRDMISSLKHPFSSVCVTGQVHGILYADSQGRPLSPLYNWLDRRGVVSVDGTTPQKRLLERAGKTMPTGYGFLTHYANRLLGKVPEGATRALGINEFVTGELIGVPISRSDASNLGPFGAFDPVTGTRDRRMMEEVVPPGSPIFPDLAGPFEVAGTTGDGVPVAYPVGDNQAGFFGLVARPASTALVSIGTSGQISIFSPSTDCPSAMELRPYLGLGFLHVGATLCAGKTYEVLERFLRDVLRRAGAESTDGESVFRMMREAAEELRSPSPLFVDAAINGTRADAARRGSVGGVSMDNLTLGNLVAGTVAGIVRELADFRSGAESGYRSLKSVVATGSAVRKNMLFRKELQRQFSLEVLVPSVDGGAALGAALIGAVAADTVELADVEGIVDAAWKSAEEEA